MDFSGKEATIWVLPPAQRTFAYEEVECRIESDRPVFLLTLLPYQHGLLHRTMLGNGWYLSSTMMAWKGPIVYVAQGWSWSGEGLRSQAWFSLFQAAQLFVTSEGALCTVSIQGHSKVFRTWDLVVWGQHNLREMQWIRFNLVTRQVSSYRHILWSYWSSLMKQHRQSSYEQCCVLIFRIRKPHIDPPVGKGDVYTGATSMCITLFWEAQ